VIALLALMTLGHGATLYVNGVRADGLRDFQLDGVTVRVDAAGDIWIDAPQYDVQVSQPAAAPTGRVSYGTTPSPQQAGTIPIGRYWLVSRDVGSTGQAVEVWVNQRLVRQIGSGQPALQVDLAPYLSLGQNTVMLYGTSAATSPAPLEVRVGTGVQIGGGGVQLQQTLLGHLQQAGPGSTPVSLSQTITVP